MPVELSVTEVGAMVTVTLQVAVLPLAVLTVMVAEPAATALTTPALVTVATLVLLEVQVSVEEAPAGRTFGFSVNVAPVSSTALVGLNETDVTAVVTVTLQVADLPLAVLTVMTAVP